MAFITCFIESIQDSKSPLVTKLFTMVCISLAGQVIRHRSSEIQELVEFFSDASEGRGLLGAQQALKRVLENGSDFHKCRQKPDLINEINDSTTFLFLFFGLK